MAQHPLPHTFTRRDVVGLSMAGMGLLSLGPLGRLLPEARGAPTGDTFAVVINLFGGNDGTNMVPPVSVGTYYDRRPTIAIAAGDGVSLDSGPAPTTDYVLHAAMPRLGALWAQGDLAVVNRVGYPDANLSHFTSQDIYSLGVRNGFQDLGIGKSGWVARYAERYAPTAMGAVSVGVGRMLDFVGGSSNPFLVDRLSSFRFDEDGSWRSNHQYRLQVVRDLLAGVPRTGLKGDAADAISQGHQLADQIQAAVEAYAGVVDYADANGSVSNIQRTMRDIATLVEYGFETRIFYTGFGGFDTHGDQGAANGYQGTLFGRLDTAIGAFAEDMQRLGVWDRTLVVVISEFGRRNYENGSGGTDHGHGSCFLVAGGAVNPGTFGPDVTDADLQEEYLPYGVDFRDVYREIIQDHLGADPTPVLPEPQPFSTNLGLVG
jgi:uncharacterized protein (DUF1501 family)